MSETFQRNPGDDEESLRSNLLDAQERGELDSLDIYVALRLTENPDALMAWIRDNVDDELVTSNDGPRAVPIV